MTDLSHNMERNLSILVGLSSKQQVLNRVFQGYLPREFVTPSMLKDVLSTIHDKLIPCYSGFQLV
jgi:hypothetical protein